MHFQTILVRAGYEVDDASGATAALTGYRRQPRDLATTDIVRPTEKASMRSERTAHVMRASRRLRYQVGASVSRMTISIGGLSSAQPK